MRLAAWERAKGELKSIAQAWYPNYDSRDKGFEEFQALTEKYIKDVESGGLIEGTDVPR